jgi:hypothetical protein
VPLIFKDRDFRLVAPVIMQPQSWLTDRIRAVLRTPILLLAAAALAVFAFATDADAQSIRGRVVDETRAGIIGVDLVLRTSTAAIEARATSDSTGSFVLFARSAGTFRLDASHAGYAEVEPIDVRLEREETLVVEIVLSPGVVAIEPLTVTARIRDARHDPTFEGARARHELYPSIGSRRVIMRSDWELASAMKVADVLGNLRPTGCVGMFYNGNLVRYDEFREAWFEVSASFVEAVEYYRRVIDAPLGFRNHGVNPSCSIIALWPRLDAPPSGRPWLRAGIAAAIVGLLLLLGT